MAAHVNSSPPCEIVGNMPVEPLVLIKWEPFDLWPDDS